MDNQQPSINLEIFYRKPKDGHGFIYKYTAPNGKNYIGQTINSLKNRAKNIISGTGYKKCTLFWKAIQKYGWNNFQVEILEEICIEELNDREIYYINFFNSIAPNGYNQTFGGDGGKTKDVYVYSAQNGQFIEHYSSLSKAEIETGVPIETISSILSEKTTRKQAHNLVFLSSYIPIFDISKLARNNYHYVYVYDKEGNYLNEFSTIREAAKQLGIGESSIRKCFNGLSAHASYYQFKNEKYDKIDPIPKNSKTPISVCQIDPVTNEILATYSSLTAAGKAVGLTSGDGIKRVILRGKGLSGGYFWKINEGSTTKCE